MGNRLSKIYTRTGDDGSTGLGDGSRTDKDALRIEAIGAVDELNSHLGVIATHELPEACRQVIQSVQHRLFDLGGELSIPGYEMIKAQHVVELENELDKLNGKMSPLKEFIVPGGTFAASTCHIARSVCRRAERRLVSLSRAETVSPQALQFLNRLSDYLFVAARYINQQAGVDDVLWQRD